MNLNRRNLLGILIGAPLATNLEAKSESKLATTVVKNLATTQQSIPETPSDFKTTIDHVIGPDSYDPAESDNSLQHWHTLPRYPILESSDPVIQTLIAALSTQEPIAFRYYGGSTPGQVRLTTIAYVFHTSEHSTIYLSAYCHLRREHRTFRADKIELV